MRFHRRGRRERREEFTPSVSAISAFSAVSDLFLSSPEAHIKAAQARS